MASSSSSSPSCCSWRSIASSSRRRAARATTGRPEPRDAQRDRRERARRAARRGPADGRRVDEAARGRADEARAAIGAAPSQAPEPRAGAAGRVRAGRPRGARRHPPAVLQPRRSSPASASASAASAPPSLAFLWPSAGGGFGAQDQRRQLEPTSKAVDRQQGALLQRRAAEIYIQPYPKADARRRRRRSTRTPASSPGMEQGYVALYQKCVHLGCRVPWCQTLAVVRVPVPRLEVQPGRREEGRPGAARPRPLRARRSTGGNIIVDTGNLVHRPADRHQHHRPEPEGAPCV